MCYILIHWWTCSLSFIYQSLLLLRVILLRYLDFLFPELWLFLLQGTWVILILLAVQIAALKDKIFQTDVFFIVYCILSFLISWVQEPHKCYMMLHFTAHLNHCCSIGLQQCCFFFLFEMIRAYLILISLSPSTCLQMGPHDKLLRIIIIRLSLS